MIFTAYIDESDTHGAKPDMVMSAMLGTPHQWKMFQRGLNRLKPEYPFKIFHATDFKGRKSDFKNWPEAKFHGFLAEIGKLTGDTLTDAATVYLPYSTYKEHFLDVRPRRMRSTSQYGLCFQALMDHLCKSVVDRGANHRLSVIVEDGHRNAGETTDLFKERKAAYTAAGEDFLRTHALARKKDTELLLIADIVVFGQALGWRAIKAGTEKHYSKRQMTEPKKGELGWNVMEITPENMKLQIEQYNQERARRHADWVERNANWRALKKGQLP